MPGMSLPVPPRKPAFSNSRETESRRRDFAGVGARASGEAGCFRSAARALGRLGCVLPGAGLGADWLGSHSFSSSFNLFIAPGNVATETGVVVLLLGGGGGVGGRIYLSAMLLKAHAGDGSFGMVGSGGPHPPY